MEIEVCRSGMQKWHDFRGIGRTLEESAGLNGIERYISENDKKIGP